VAGGAEKDDVVASEPSLLELHEVDVMRIIIFGRWVSQNEKTVSGNMLGLATAYV